MALRYRLSEAAEELRISLRNLEDLITDGAITVHQDRPGGHRFVSEESLRAYIRDREEVQVVGRRLAG